MESSSWTVGRLGEAIGAQVEGDAHAAITGAGAIDSAGPGDVTFAVDERRAKLLDGCKASAVILGPGAQTPPSLTVLRVADPEAAFARVLALLAPPDDLPPPGVHPSAVVQPTARLGKDVAVGPCVVVGAGACLGDGVVLCPNVTVGAEAMVGDSTVLMPGVVVYARCRIGRRCRIHANAVIGADGFGYYTRQGAHHKVPHIGTVEIGDDVEIGACSCVDRAKFDVTRVGAGSKIDNLVQIAHNVQIGRCAVLAGQAGVAGSAKLGDHVVLGGHVGVRDNVTIGDAVQVTGYSAVARDVEAGQVVSGIPAIPVRTHIRAAQVFERLPDLATQLRQLQARVDALEDAAKNDSA